MVEDDSHRADPHVLLFGERDAEHPDDLTADHAETGRRTRPDPSDVHRARRRARARRRRSAVVLVLLLAILLVAGLVGWKALGSRFRPKDYSGGGTGSVLVTVHDGDDATAIGQTLVGQGVVASVRAFVNAADANTASRGIQPGAYRLREHMSGTAALGLLLDPSARVSRRVTLPEGVTILDVENRLASALQVPVADVKAAAANVAALGIPVSYGRGSAAPTSAEGFFWPDTYSFDPGTSPSAALASMVGEFAGRDRDLGFSDAARAEQLSPYQALIIASIVESEAKFDVDRPKVARVILNRLAAHTRLQVDATSAYAAKLAGLDPTKVVYSTIDSPYNSYTHDGLPPTPIDNPGAASLKAAMAPATGAWLYYVNIDAAGHLGFFADDASFEAARQTCIQNNWGCG